MTHEEFKQHIADLGYEDAVIFEDPNYDSAYIGMSHDGRVVYSYDKMIEYLIEDDSMTFDEACEFIDFNTIRALPYAGERAPIVVYDDPDYIDLMPAPEEDEDE